MDETTLREFSIYQVSGSKSNVSNLNHLSKEEKQLYVELRTGNIRLEQERIPQQYVNKWLESSLS